MTAKRNFFYLILATIIIFVGLSTRSHPHWFPAIIAKYGGDTLWAALFLFPLRMMFPKTQLVKLAAVNYAFGVMIEISQLWQTPWINNVRHTTFGHLFLGFGFLWSDIVCYAIGTLFAWAIIACVERYWLRTTLKPACSSLPFS